MTVFSAMLQAHPDIKLVYTSNDLAAAGAYIAAKQAGKLDQVKIIGTDGLPGPVGRHPLGRGGPMGRHLRLSDRRRRGARSRQADPDRLRDLGAAQRDGADHADRQGEREGALRQGAVLQPPCRTFLLPPGGRRRGKELYPGSLYALIDPTGPTARGFWMPWTTKPRAGAGARCPRGIRSPENALGEPDALRRLGLDRRLRARDLPGRWSRARIKRASRPSSMPF